MPDVITCTSEGDDPSGRRRPGVNRPDDAPARPAQGCELGAMARENPPAGRDREPVCEPHDSTGEPGAGNRHAGFGERGEETYPRESACGPAAKAPGCATDPYRLRASPRLYKAPLHSNPAEFCSSPRNSAISRCIPAAGVAPRSQMPQFAPSLRLVSRAHRHSRCDAGFHHGLLVIVDQVDVNDLVVLETKHDTPIARHTHAPHAGLISVERVKPETGSIRAGSSRSYNARNPLYLIFTDQL